MNIKHQIISLKQNLQQMALQKEEKSHKEKSLRLIEKLEEEEEEKQETPKRKSALNIPQPLFAIKPEPHEEKNSS